MAVVLLIVLAVCLLTNPKQKSYSLRIVVPAGSEASVVYAEEEISPIGSYVTVSSGARFGGTEVSLKPSEENAEASCG